MTILTAMTDAEFALYMAGTIPRYARQKVTSGAWDEASSLELSRRQIEALVPEGLATPGQYLNTIRDPASGQAVGILWFGIKEQAGKQHAYVWDIAIKPEYQRQGYGSRAFKALEAQVQALGLAGIALHVFGHNQAAYALYLKLGYLPTDIMMFKQLEAG